MGSKVAYISCRVSLDAAGCSLAAQQLHPAPPTHSSMRKFTQTQAVFVISDHMGAISPQRSGCHADEDGALDVAVVQRGDQHQAHHGQHDLHGKQRAILRPSTPDHDGAGAAQIRGKRMYATCGPHTLWARGPKGPGMREALGPHLCRVQVSKAHHGFFILDHHPRFLRVQAHASMCWSR